MSAFNEPPRRHGGLTVESGRDAAGAKQHGAEDTEETEETEETDGASTIEFFGFLRFLRPFGLRMMAACASLSLQTGS